MELYPLPEATKYNYVKSEVKNAYLQILDIYVPDHVLERGIYFLRKNGINVNFVTLSYTTYLILKYKVGISYKEFKYMMDQKRIKYKRLLRETKRKIFKPIA